MNQIVSTNWVYKNINDKKIIIFDCSWRMPGEKTYDFKEFSKYHLKKSIFFNIDEISNIKSKLPHTIPSPIFFEKKMRNFGVNRNSIIILYDIFGIFSAPRVWWMFKYFGHEKVYLMNGGLKKWLKEKKPTTNKLFKIKKGNFTSKINKDLITNYNFILKNIDKENILILDARNNKRYKGKEKEINSNLRSGHIPGSKNLFWKDLITINGTFKSKKEIYKIIENFKIRKNKHIITSCGSGITACILSLMLLNYKKVKSSVYVGSWREWGKMSNLPIEK